MESFFFEQFDSPGLAVEQSWWWNFIMLYAYEQQGPRISEIRDMPFQGKTSKFFT